MDREAEELQLLGVGGETFDNVLRSSRNKLVCSLSLTLLLPLSFATVALYLLSAPLLIPKSNQYIFIDDGALPVTNLESWGLQQTQTTSRAFIFELWMLSIVAVLYTAASIYTANEVSSAKAMTVVSMAWKRLALTLFWFFTIVLAYSTVYILALFLLIYTARLPKFVNSGEFLFGSIPIPVVFFCVLVYINMVGYLASVLSVLQEKYYGMAAMRKRRHVIKRKRTAVVGLLMLYFIFTQSIVAIFGQEINLLMRDDEVLIGAGAVYGTTLNGLLCLVMLWGLSMQNEL